MDLTTIMSVLVPLLSIGVVGDIVMRIIFRSERKKENEKANQAVIETQQKENQMWHDRLKDSQDTIKDLHEIIDKLTESRKTLEAENADKTHHIRKINDEKQKAAINYERRLAAKDRYISFLFNWHCRRENNGKEDGCGRRLPQQPFPMSYNPPDDIKAQLEAKGPETVEVYEEEEETAEINVTINSEQS